MSFSGTLSVTTATNTLVTYISTPLFSGVSAASSGSGYITVASTGLYLVNGLIAYASNSTGSRGAIIYLNGSALQTSYYPTCPDNATTVSVSQTLNLLSNAVISLYAYQTSGSSLNVTFATLSVIRIA